MYQLKPIRSLINVLIKDFLTAKKVILVATFPLVACQTPIDVTGDQHKLVTDKWKALANYTESSLTKFGVTVSAKLLLRKDKTTHFNQLASIQLSNEEKFNHINLLSPEFLSKYSCHYSCESLNKYITDPSLPGTTGLIEYFSEYEFELFKFYAELIQLNAVIDKIATNEPQLWASYLEILVTELKSFDSLPEFSRYLTKMLHKSTSEKQFVIDNFPYRQQQSEIDIYFNSPNKSWLFTTPNNNWHETAANGGQDNANDGWQKTGHSFSDIYPIEMPRLSSKENSLQPPIKNQTSSTGQTSQTGIELFSLPLPSDYVSSESTFNFWTNAKKEPYEIGDKVCSYEDNFFGTVENIKGQKIQVLTQGQAKMIDELGSVINKSKGALFDTSKEFTFQTLSQQITFNHNDIAKCSIDTI